MSGRALQPLLLTLLLLTLLLLCVAVATSTAAASTETTSSQLRGVADVAANDPLAVVPSSPVIDASDFTTNAVAFARNEALGVALAGIAIFVAAGGGTGGGGILDPIYILIMKLDAKVAIPLSSITIVGGAIANLLINVRRARKHSTAPLIDWDLILVMQPMLLMGASFGTLINRLAPTWLLCVLLVVVLTATGIRTLQKAISLGRHEPWFPRRFAGPERTQLLGRTSTGTGTAGGTTDSYNARPRLAAGPAPPTKPFTGSKGRRLGTAADSSTTVVPSWSLSLSCGSHDSDRTAAIPWRKLGLLALLFGGIVALSLLQLLVPAGSWLLAVVALLPSLFLIVFVHFAMRNVVATFEQQQQPHFVLGANDVQWTPQMVRYFPLCAIAAGMVAGMFGIGGGIINGPLLLELGIDPSAASAMTATTVLFSSAMSSFSYALMGSLNYSFAAVMFPIGFVTTFIGHVCLLRVVQRYKCPSLIIFSMAIIVLVSAIAMSIESIKELVNA